MLLLLPGLLLLLHLLRRRWRLATVGHSNSSRRRLRRRRSVVRHIRRWLHRRRLLLHCRRWGRGGIASCVHLRLPLLLLLRLHRRLLRLMMTGHGRPIGGPPGLLLGDG